MTSPIRVLIADDHAVLRSGLSMLLGVQADIAVIGEAADGGAAVARTRELQPDVLLLDLSMPGPSGADVIRQALHVSPRSRVLVLTMHDDPAYLASAMLAGAAGYVVKKVADTELIQAIRAVHAGRTFVDLTRSSDPHPRPKEAGGRSAAEMPKNLSRREVEVLRLLAQGNSNQQVADQIHLSVKTVETYRTRLSEKLGLKGRSELYRFAVESGVLDTETGPPPEE